MRLGLALILGLWAAGAQAQCRQALALGLDVSGSVDSIEYRLQLDGLAGALLRPEVQQAFLSFPASPVRLYVFEWAGTGSQRQLLPWTSIESAGDLIGIADILRATPRAAEGTRDGDRPGDAVRRGCAGAAARLLAAARWICRVTGNPTSVRARAI